MPDRGLVLLALTGIIGGGAVAYYGVRASREGGIFRTDPEIAREPKATGAEAILVGAGAVIVLRAYAEAAEEIGWSPLVLGSLGIVGIGLVGRARR